MQNVKRETTKTPQKSTSYSPGLGIPVDTWKEIFSQLNARETARIARTCTFFNQCKNDNAVLTKSLKNSNEECYLIVNNPHGVKSPKDFMEKIVNYKNKAELARFLGNFNTIFLSLKEAVDAQNQIRATTSIFKIKLPVPYLKYLIQDSGCYTFGNWTKPENANKIIGFMETPTFHTGSYGL